MYIVICSYDYTGNEDKNRIRCLQMGRHIGTKIQNEKRQVSGELDAEFLFLLLRRKSILYEVNRYSNTELHFLVSRWTIL